MSRDPGYRTGIGAPVHREIPDAPTAGMLTVAHDANVLDRDGTARDALVDGFLALVRDGRVRLFVPAGVAAEMSHPRAPALVRAAVAVAPVAAGGSLTARQHIDRIRVRAIMRGDGRPGKHDADASHLSEAAEAGCCSFVTRDGKILRKRDTLRLALPPGFEIVSLEDFMAQVGAGRGRA